MRQWQRLKALLDGAQVSPAEVEAWWRRPPEAWGPGERLLACGAAVIAELRAAVRDELGYSCSAGGRLYPAASPTACMI